MKTDRIILTQTKSGHIAVTWEIPGEPKPRSFGAAKGSPIGQAVNLLERLLELVDIHDVKEYGR